MSLAVATGKIDRRHLNGGLSRRRSLTRVVALIHFTTRTISSTKWRSGYRNYMHETFSSENKNLPCRSSFTTQKPMLISPVCIFFAIDGHSTHAHSALVYDFGRCGFRSVRQNRKPAHTLIASAYFQSTTVHLGGWNWTLRLSLAVFVEVIHESPGQKPLLTAKGLIIMSVVHMQGYFGGPVFMQRGWISTRKTTQQSKRGLPHQS